MATCWIESEDRIESNTTKLEKLNQSWKLSLSFISVVQRSWMSQTLCDATEISSGAWQVGMRLGTWPGVELEDFCRDRAPDFVWAPQAKRMHQVVQIDFENYIFSPLLRGGTSLSDTPISTSAEALTVLDLGATSLKKFWICLCWLKIRNWTIDKDLFEIVHSCFSPYMSVSSHLVFKFGNNVLCHGCCNRRRPFFPPTHCQNTALSLYINISFKHAQWM